MSVNEQSKSPAYSYVCRKLTPIKGGWESDYVSTHNSKRQAIKAAKDGTNIAVYKFEQFPDGATSTGKCIYFDYTVVL